MTEPKFFVADTDFENSYELLKKFLTIYSTAINMNPGKSHLRPRLLEILTYYVLKGYSKETKTLILDSIEGMNVYNLNQINSELQKNGFLLEHKYQDHSRVLAPELQKLKDYIDDSDGNVPLFVLRFNKK